MERLLLKFLNFFLPIEVKIDGVAEAGSYRAIGFVGNAKNVNFGMLLAFFLLEPDGVGRNLHREVHARGVSRLVKKRKSHGGGNIASLRSVGAALKILLDGFAGEWIHRAYVAIATARTNDGSAAVDLHLECVAAAFWRDRWCVSENVVLGLFASNFLESSEQVVRVDNDEPTRTLGQLIKDLLVGRSARRELRDDLPRLIVRVVEVVGIIHTRTTSATAAAASTATSAAATLAASSATPASLTAPTSTTANPPSSTARMTPTSATAPASVLYPKETRMTARRFSRGVLVKVYGMDMARAHVERDPNSSTGCGAHRRRTPDHQSTNIDRIDCDVLSVAGIDHGGQLGLDFGRRSEAGSQKDQALAPGDIGEILCHRPQR